MKLFVNAVSRNWRWTVFSIFTIALLIRVTFILTLQDGFYFPDSISYSGAAVKLINNGELGEIYDRPPGYPVFLAAIYLLFGESILAIRMVESMLGAFLAVIIALIGDRIGGKPVGALAGILWSIYPIGVFIAGLIYPTNVMTMLLACGVACLLPYSHQELSPIRIFIAGVLWGLATLTIPIALITLAAIGLWLMYWERKTRRALLVSLLFLGAAMVVIPWTIRDFYVYGRLVLVEPRLVSHLPVLNIETGARGRNIEALLNQPAQFVAHFTGEFIHFWKIYPDRIAMADPEFRQRFHEIDSRVIKSTIFTPNNLINTVSVLSTGPLFLFALIGTVAMWFERERRRELSFLWATIFSFAFGYSFFYAQMRYRIPIEPCIIILSSYGLTKSWRVLIGRMACRTSVDQAQLDIPKPA
jgi:4-amino-4-deoxy-L-arabinose transferase-like glycosyltransferase